MIVNDSPAQDQAAYETLRKIYANTKNDIMRHVAENVTKASSGP